MHPRWGMYAKQLTTASLALKSSSMLHGPRASHTRTWPSSAEVTRWWPGSDGTARPVTHAACAKKTVESGWGFALPALDPDAWDDDDDDRGRSATCHTRM